MIMNKIHILKRNILFESSVSRKAILIGKGLPVVSSTFDIVSQS
jgi:hypothetical protein